MSYEQDIENVTKAVQCAELLLQDLQDINRNGNSMLSMLVLPEIEKVAGIKHRIEAIVSALNDRE
ncbi:MAG: hypothetical protein ACYDEV_00505 [Acidiferrobacter sp.]